MSFNQIDPNMIVLAELFPTLFQGKLPRTSSQIPDGWLPLVEDLFADIETKLNGHNVQFEILQVKEKLGSLRLYFRLGEAGRVMSGRLPPESFRSLHDEIYARILIASEQSSRVCAACGISLGQSDQRVGLPAICASHSLPTKNS